MRTRFRTRRSAALPQNRLQKANRRDVRGGCERGNEARTARSPAISKADTPKKNRFPGSVTYPTQAELDTGHIYFGAKEDPEPFLP